MTHSDPEINAIYAEMAEAETEAQREAQANEQAYLARKAEQNKPRTAATITLVGGKVLPFASAFEFFLARAFYSKLGAIASLWVSWPTLPVAVDHPQFLLASPAVAMAEAA